MSIPVKKENCTTGCVTPGSVNGFVKSSAYAPVSLNLMGMYLVKEHMNAHYKRIYNVKAAVDTKPPHSMQGNRSKSAGPSRANSRCSSRQGLLKLSSSNQELNSRENMHLMDKIDKYLDSVQDKNPRKFFSSNNLAYMGRNRTHGTTNNRLRTARRNRASSQSPDLLERHKDYFTNPSDPFIPRTLLRNAQSRVTRSRNSLPPSQRTINRPNSGQCLRKYSERSSSFQREKRLVPALKIQRDIDHVKWLTDQARKTKAEKKLVELDHVLQQTERSDITLQNQETINSKENLHLRKSRSLGDHEPRQNVNPEANQGRRISMSSRDEDLSQYISKRNLVKEQLEAEEEELKYLEFITEVTNEILIRGVYTDRALKEVFQYHMNRRDDLDFAKMKTLLGKLQDDLGIPRFEMQFSSNFENILRINASNPYSSLTSAVSSSWQKPLLLVNDNEDLASTVISPHPTSPSTSLDRKIYTHFNLKSDGIEREKDGDGSNDSTEIEDDVSNNKVNIAINEEDSSGTKTPPLNNIEEEKKDVPSEVSQQLDEQESDEVTSKPEDENIPSSQEKIFKTDDIPSPDLTDKEVASLLDYSDEEFESSHSEND